VLVYNTDVLMKDQQLGTCVSPKGVERPCSIVERKADEVKIHYDGWDNLYDEWLQKTSDRLVEAKPIYTPAKISIVIGGGEDTSMPFPLCAKSHCAGMQNNYFGSSSDAEAVSGTQTSADTFSEAFRDAGGKLPLDKITASSSAFGGGIDFMPAPTQCFEMGTWVSSAPGGDTYKVGAETVADIRNAPQPGSQWSADYAAKNNLHLFTDGGMTDDDGIGWAISSGATQIVSFVINSNWVNHFTGGIREQGTMPVGQYFGHYCEESKDSVLEQQEFWPRQTYKDHKFLEYLTYGSLQCTTVHNPLFGIRAGMKVDLIIYYIKTSDVSIGEAKPENYYDYGEVAQEVLGSFPEATGARMDPWSLWNLNSR